MGVRIIWDSCQKRRGVGDRSACLAFRLRTKANPIRNHPHIETQFRIDQQPKAETKNEARTPAQGQSSAAGDWMPSSGQQGLTERHLVNRTLQLQDVYSILSCGGTG